jgi:hypothetical protein
MLQPGSQRRRPTTPVKTKMYVRAMDAWIYVVRLSSRVTLLCESSPLAAMMACNVHTVDMSALLCGLYNGAVPAVQDL